MGSVDAVDSRRSRMAADSSETQDLGLLEAARRGDDDAFDLPVRLD